MQLIKENFYTVVKLWINQFGMMFFGVLVLLPTANSSITWLMPAVSIFAILFYFTLIFWVCCEVGLHDSVKIEGGRMKKMWYKCTVLSLVAYLPSLVASVISCIAKAFIPGVAYFESAQGATGGAASVYSIATLFNEVFHLMYKGLLVFLNLDGFPFTYFITAILALTVCTVGYNMGTKGYLSKLLSKNKDR